MFNKKENETKDISNHIEEKETRKNGKNRKKYWIIAVPICVLLLLCAGYHGYSHYMVSQFYKYIDADDTEGADITIQNNEGKTAYDIAVELGYEDRLENKSETDEVLEKIKVNNPYFYTNDDVNLTATLTYRDLEEQIVRDGTLNMKLVKNYENGDLYKLSVDDKEKIQECLSEDRLNVYFYVTEDEIYRLWSYIYQDEEVIRFYNDDDLIVKYLDTDDKLIANGELVCCKESVPDKLDWPESGSHVDIIQQNDQVEYDRVDLNANGDRQFYERFIWEKGKGLVEFRSGFRVEADILYIENITKQ